MSVETNTRTIEIECLRYDPDTKAPPRYQSYMVPFQHDTSVLQGLQVHQGQP